MPSRFLTAALAVLLAFGLAACSSKGDDARSAATALDSPGDRAGLTAGGLVTQRTAGGVTATTGSSSTSTTLPTTTLPATTTTSLTVEQVAERLRPSVVGVRVVVGRSEDQTVSAVGTGVVFSKDGLVVTNNHVVTGQGREAGSEVWITLSTGRRLQADLVGRDPDTDLAVLRVGPVRLVPALFRTDLTALTRGDPVVAVGNAEYLERPVTSGRVTALLNDVSIAQIPGLERFIQADAPIAQGNSGGPLADAQGRVIGINVGIPLREGEVLTAGGVAIPADVVVEAVRKIIEAEGLGE